MRRLLVAVSLAVLLTAACDQTDDAGETGSNDSFGLTGRVVTAEAGVEPENLPDSDNGEDVRDEGTPNEGGGLLVEPQDPDDADGLDGCAQRNNGYAVYYTEDTSFDPVETVDDGDFPDALVGRTVLVEGMLFRTAEEDTATDDAGADVDVDADVDANGGNAGADADAQVETQQDDETEPGVCVLVAGSIEVEDEARATDAGGPAGGRGDAEEEPPAPSPPGDEDGDRSPTPTTTEQVDEPTASPERDER